MPGFLQHAEQKRALHRSGPGLAPAADESFRIIHVDGLTERRKVIRYAGAPPADNERMHGSVGLYAFLYNITLNSRDAKAPL